MIDVFACTEEEESTLVNYMDFLELHITATCCFSTSSTDNAPSHFTLSQPFPPSLVPLLPFLHTVFFIYFNNPFTECVEP